MSGHSSWSSHGAMILQATSNSLFSTPASVGWYEVLASVHRPYQRSSQANKNLKCNLRLVEFMNEFRSSESSVSDLLFLLDAVGWTASRVKRKGFCVPLKGINPPFQCSHTVIYHLSVVFTALQEFLCKVI